METESVIPQTLQEAILIYSDPKACHDLMVQLRWPDGVVCPHCASSRVTLFATKPVFKCKDCRKQFTVKVGTIFEDSPLSLSKWLPAMWMIANCKNGISSCELARGLGVMQRTAWFMLHRIRHAMTNGTIVKLSGIIEADETFVGGIEKNKHDGKKLKAGRGTVGKVVVAGMLERGGGVRVKTVPNTSAPILQSHIRENVEAGSALMTDAHGGYRGIDTDYRHAVVDHAVEYVRENIIHTNGMENYWSLLKRTIKGTYVAIDVPHLDSYLDEQTFRFNNRGLNDAGRFLTVAGEVDGKRLTYKDLIGRE